MASLNDQPIRVAVVPPTPAFDQNALFESRRLDKSSHSPNAHWMDCFAAIRDRGRELNVVFETVDMTSLDDANVVIYMAQPDSPRDVITNSQRHPKHKSVLLMCETSLGSRYVSNPKNHVVYDAVITYVDTLVDNKRYFFLPPRTYYRDRITNGLPFGQRKIGCLVGTNRRMKYRTGLMAMRKGWKFSLKDWIDYVSCPGELISYRTEVGKMCAKYRERGFDLFGEGWDLLRETRDICKGIPAKCVLDYIGNYRYYFALENHSGACSLISERVWDALWGDAVPVYLGNTRLSEFIPPECYIDARQFRNPQEMLDYLCGVSERVWGQYRSAGREFIHSEQGANFLPETFAETFVGYITAIVHPESKLCYARS
jgi:hypothetical protein